MSPRRWVEEADRSVRAVLAVTVLALFARLVLLGERTAHFDEARVAYWTLEYLETGNFHYRFIIHGPLVQHVNRVLFALLGPTDFVARLPVALVGGTLPLAALLFRDRLDRTEVVGLAVLLAVNPVLLYYSRFFRSTVLVAAFCFVAFGLLVRLWSTPRPRGLYGVAAFLALGFAAKENAVVYVLCWLGAGALLLDYALLAPRDGATGVDRLRSWGERARRTARDPSPTQRRLAGHAVGAVGLCCLLTLFFYAPRSADPAGVGLWNALAEPARLPGVVEATVADIRRGLEYWFGGSADPGCHKENLMAGYACYLGRFLGVLGGYAAPLSGFAVVGFLRERYATERPRPVVMATAYWGFASVLGYPLGTDIFGAWITVNAIVPLAVPAAVGLAMVVEWGREAFDAEDRVGVGLAAAVLLVVAGQVATAAVGGVYLAPQSADNDLVQYAQPADDLRPVVRDIRAAAVDNAGVDVLFYGPEITVPPSEARGPDPPCSKMVATLPLQWYLAAADANGTCAHNETALEARFDGGLPPVIIVHADSRRTVERRVEGYVPRTYRLRTTGRRIVFLVEAEYVDGESG